MSDKNLAMKTTLADLVVKVAKYEREFRRELKRNKLRFYDYAGELASKSLEDNYQKTSQIEDGLTSARKFSYDASVIQLVGSTYHLLPEDIVAGLSHITFPSDEMWIEGPSPFPEEPQQRVGILIKANQATGEFSFVYATAKPTEYFEGLTKFAVENLSLNGMTLDSISVEIKVSTNGIDLNEDKLIAAIVHLNEINQQIGITTEASWLISEAYGMADFLARFFLVLSSNNVPNNFNATETEAEKVLNKKNQSRVKMGFAPFIQLRPVLIDMAKIGQRAMLAKTAKQVRLLLGWTWVRRSKEIISKYGVIFRRNPHDRRIAAPVDRRNVAREIFSSDPNLAIDVTSGRSIRVPKSVVSSQQCKP